ncbi:hypothetical protein HWV62_18460 [Athelia sp. TMB]|nr:hypothetical protein HWV62_18460 [Athelia sp. TMB]
MPEGAMPLPMRRAATVFCFFRAPGSISSPFLFKGLGNVTGAVPNARTKFPTGSDLPFASIRLFSALNFFGGSNICQGKTASFFSFSGSDDDHAIAACTLSGGNRRSYFKRVISFSNSSSLNSCRRKPDAPPCILVLWNPWTITVPSDEALRDNAV